MASVREVAVVHDIVRLLIENDGEMMQGDLVDEINDIDSMIYRTLSHLDDAGKIEKETCLIDTRTNMVKLKDDWE